jgi:putative glutamine amidotransferase
MDSALIDMAIKKNIPLYGFCRGMQSILVYFGNSLTNISGHVAVRHMVNGSIGSREVNSYHNQACVALNDDSLKIMEQSDDGVIEAVKHNKYPIMGTMWHPERENPFRIDDVEMVRKLFGGV